MKAHAPCRKVRQKADGPRLKSQLIGVEAMDHPADGELLDQVG
jgi:hypothetical protein